MRTLHLVVTICLCLQLVLVGCAGKQAAPEQPPEQPIVLKVSFSGPPTGAREKAYVQIYQEIERRAKGKIKFEFYYAESLLKLKDGLQGIRAGLADIAPFVPSYTIQETPFGLLAVPYVYTDLLASYKAVLEMYKEYPEVIGLGWSHGVKPGTSPVIGFMPSFAGKLVIVTSPRAVRTPEDLKGLKLRAVGRTADWLKSLGATTSSISYTEVYTAIERGTIDGGQFYLTDVCAYKVEEVVKYITDLGAGYWFTRWDIINGDTWNKLPVEVRKIFLDIREEAAEILTRATLEEEDACVQSCAKRGVQMIRLSGPELERWKQTSKFLWEEYFRDIDARPELQGYLKQKGLTGEKIMMRIPELVKKYSK